MQVDGPKQYTNKANVNEHVMTLIKQYQIAGSCHMPCHTIVSFKSTVFSPSSWYYCAMLHACVFDCTLILYTVVVGLKVIMKTSDLPPLITSVTYNSVIDS